MSLADLPEVLSLSPDEKFRLVDELLISACSSEHELTILPLEEKAALDSRWENYLKNPNTAFSVDAFRKKMDALRG